MPPIEMTKAQVDDLIKGILGPQIAEMRKENEALGRQLLERQTHYTEAITGLGAPRPVDDTRKGLTAARFAIAIAGSSLARRGGGEVSARAYAEKLWGPNDAVTKALSATDFTSGGALLPTEVSAEIIEFLRPASKFRLLNPEVMPMDNGKMAIPKIAGGASASYSGENQNITATTLQFGDVDLSAKKLTSLIPISNDLLRRRANAEGMVRNDMVAAIAQASDSKFWRGDGTQNTPKGLRFQIPTSNVIPSNQTLNLANATNDLVALIQALAGNNSRMIRCGWGMSSRSHLYLANLLSTNGQFVFKDEMAKGTLMGYPYQWTNIIPDNLTVNSVTGTSEVYFADFADVVIGETTQLLLDTSAEAAYWDGSQMQSSFGKDQTLLRAVIEHDLGVRHDFSTAVLTQVIWGK